jgi:DNA-binding LacI/PurR family transcriptional regulator
MLPRVSMADIARQAGVSKNTVSLALRHSPQIPPVTRKRITTLARKMGYQAHPVVAHLMTQLRLSRQTRFQSTLALINANRDPHAFRSHPTIPTYVEGCRRRARALGYSLDEFWLYQPDLTGTRLRQVLQARSIPGAIFVGLMQENRLPDTAAEIWPALPCVVTGVRTQQPALSFACADHHMLALKAVQHCLALGYQRPALVLDQVIDGLVDHRFSSGFASGLGSLAASARCRPFFRVREADQNRGLFHRWLEREQPDVILTLYNRIRNWVEDTGRSVPRDIGFVQLEWRPHEPDWAGMDQHNDVVGEAAVEMLIGMIHHGTSGPPEFPRATLIGSTWRDGPTLPRRT